MIKEKNHHKLKKIDINKFKFLITLFGVLPPLFYMIGLGYYYGRLTAYGVDPEVLSPSIQEVYISAYVAVVVLCIDLMNLIKDNMLIIVMSLLLGLIFQRLIRCSITVYCRKYKIRRNIVKIRKLYRNYHSFSYSIFLVSFLPFLILYVLFVPLIIWYLPMQSHSKGLERAGKERIKFMSQECYFEENKIWSNCKVLKDESGAVLTTGILVASTEKYVAFFTKTGSTIYPFPKNGSIQNNIKDTIPDSQ